MLVDKIVWSNSLNNQTAFYFSQKYHEACDDYQMQHDASTIQSPTDRQPTWLEPVFERVGAATERYKNLELSSVALLDKLRNVCVLEETFGVGEAKMDRWVADTQETLLILQERGNAESPADVACLLDELKDFTADAIQTGGRQLDAVKRAANQLVDSLKELGSDDRTLGGVRDRVNALQDGLGSIVSNAGTLANRLQTEQVRGLDVHEGIQQLLAWLDSVDRDLGVMSLVSVDEETLQKQTHQLWVVKNDVDNHTSSMQAVNSLAVEYAAKPSPAADDVAMRELAELVGKLTDRFTAVKERCLLLHGDVDQIASKLVEFTASSKRYNDWLMPMLTTLKSAALTQLPMPAFKEKVADIGGEAKEELADLVLMRKLAQDLIESPKTCDVGDISAASRDAECKWEGLKEVLMEREAEVKARKPSSLSWS